jgi:lipoprotein signal peptidase
MGVPGPFWAEYLARLRVLAVVGAVFFALDQISKLVAAALDPRWYVHNPKPHAGWWIPIAMALAVCLLPGRRFAAAGGLWVGGAAGNVLDLYVWPGGVPDFIHTPWPHGIWNLADLFILSGAVLLAGLILPWPFLALRRRRRHGGTVQSWLRG